MKYRALISATALVSTSFTPISLMTVPAQAANPTVADAQLYCDNTYVNNQTDPSVWRSTVTNFTEVDGDTTQVDGSARDINPRPDYDSTFVYAGFSQATDPLVRIGGSPNMWGHSVFTQKIYDNSLVDVEADFTHTVTFTWTCHVEEYVTTVTHVGGGEGGGSGNNGNNNGQNEQDGGNGNGNNGCGNGNGGPNGTNDNCGGHDVTTSEWTNAVDYTDGSAAGDTVDEGYSTISTNESRTGHLEGVDYVVNGYYPLQGVYSLACISPGKKGGTWTAKAYYTGGHCSTTTFNAAPTVLGNTFDTITGTLPSNSLPQ